MPEECITIMYAHPFIRSFVTKNFLGSCADRGSSQYPTVLEQKHYLHISSLLESPFIHGSHDGVCISMLLWHYFIWCNKVCDSSFDIWPLTAFRLHSSTFPPAPCLDRLVWKPACSLPWHKEGSSNHANIGTHVGTLSPTLLPKHNKKPKPFAPSFTQAKQTDLNACPALSRMPHDVMNIFIPSWWFCGIVRLDIWTNFGRGWLIPLLC